MEQLKSWLKERHQLAVAVYSTGAADAILARHGLSIVDFLRPLSLVNQLNVPMRVGEFSMRVQEVKLSLFAGNSMYQPKPEVIDEALRQLLTVQAQRHATLQALPNLIQHVQSEPPESINPWFASYQGEFLRLVRFTEHETLDHPAGGLFFMPAGTTQPLAVAEKLLSEAPLPLHTSGAALAPSDPLFAKHWVLLQDVGAPDMDDARALNNLAALSNIYGAANCSILRLHGSSSNSAAAGPASAVPAAVFQACRQATLPGGGAGEPEQRPQEPQGGLGQGLHPDDMAAAGALLREFAERSLLPRVEERMARLNLAVSTARKGLKNRLTRLWKGAAAEPGPSMETSYTYHSIEGQMRALADLAYLLGQYEFAVQSYRLAAQDYLSAPNSKWYAGAEEMIGLCSTLTSDPSADPLKYFNRAYEHYSKVRGRQGRMLATRTMLYAALYQAATGRHHAASMSLMRAHFDEEAARAALLLEAAAYCLLRCRPASVRKAAFHLVLAGLRYHSAKQKRLSIHCYKQVTGIYSASAWRHINEHLHDILGKQCAELGDAQGCLQHSAALLDCGHRQAAAQAHYLARFLEAVQAAGVVGPVQGLNLPQVVTDEVLVRYADQRCYSPNTPASLLPGLSSSSSSSSAAAGDGEASLAESAAAVWGQLELSLAGGEAPSTNWLDGAKQVHDGEEFNTVAAGEEIAVQVTFKNPLAIKLSLSHVRLQVQFTPAGAGSTGAGAGAAAAAADGPAAAAAAPKAEEVTVVESQFSLHPGEQLTESLLLRPLAAGWLRVTGVAWLLGGVAAGFAEFDVKGRKRKKPKGDRPSQRKHYPPSKRLVFHVLRGMPRLVLSLDGLPAEAAAGELLRLQQQPGRFVFQCAWFCEPQEPVCASMRHRVLLSHHSMAVAPLLELAGPSVSPCVQNLHCYNLRLQATASKEAPGALLLRQISCLSSGADAGWRLRSFSSSTQQLNPVRMTLEGPGLQAPHKHDFRAALLCIVPLTLKLRNCGTAAVSLTVRAAGAWEGLAADHAWHLEPGGSVDVVLQVAVFKPGVYVLDDYGVDWRCEGMVGAGGRVRQGSKVGEAVVLKVESP
ncbi:hypothetical protein OEZ85_007140 [Tetradesmus obliquus]|uniref:TPPC8 first Ig-like domain-containing protein n=1 Tax=Tetradesmus obliquus TaxID=3088 RepID=A0ABY8TWP3_TETOB|nr:hypothetical protein OEZ85_007140 [Tetradesmus obliquus]